MKKIVIIGGGPIGLLAAIKLKELGLHVIVVDPRADEYIRTGTLNPSIIAMLLQKIGMDDDVDESSDYHIKDAEYLLIAVAMELGVEIKKASFIQFENNGVKIKFADGSLENLACELAIDATGEMRVLVNEVKKIEENAFTIEPIVNDVSKKYLIAYVKLSDVDRRELKLYERGLIFQSDDLSYVRKLDGLREMGWRHFFEPEIYLRFFRKKKVCIYVSIPPNLAESNREAWLQKVLAFKTGKDDISFQQIPPSLKDKGDKAKADKKYAAKKKMRFNDFTVYLHKVIEPYSIGKNRPTVLLLGDSRANSLFSIGKGFEFGMLQIDDLIKSIYVEDENNFTIDFTSYAQLSKSTLENYEAIISQHYAQLSGIMKKVLIVQMNRYLSATSLAQDPGEKNKLTSFCEVLNAEIAKNLFTEGVKRFKDALVEGKNQIKLDQYSLLDQEADKALKESIELLEESLNYSKDELTAQILSQLKNIALKYIELAKFYLNTSLFGTARQYYILANNILLQDYFLGDNKKEILENEYRIAKTHIKMKNYMPAITIIRNIEQEMNRIKFSDQEKLPAKIKYARVFLSFNILLTPGFSSTLNQETLDSCEKDYLEVIADERLSDKKSFVLKQLLDQIIEKIGLNSKINYKQ